MPSKQKFQQHVTDFIFTFSLLGIFTVAALLVMIFGARIYQRIITQSQSNYEISTPLSYLSEKIRQNDTADSVYLTQLDAVPALALESTENGEGYITYLYVYDGWLRELYQKKDDPLSPSAGQAVLELHSLKMQQVSPQLLYFESANAGGDSSSIYIQLNAQNGD